MSRNSTVALALLMAAGLLPSRLFPQALPHDTVRVTVGSRVVAGAAAATRAVDVLDRAAIDALPAGTVTEALARALGVDVQARSAAQADLSIRGSSFEQVLVLVDGVAVNDRQTGHFHLDQAVPLDAVERIEVLRGPASALYGSAAMGGVVNIVTRRGRSEVGARTRIGSFGGIAIGVDAGTGAGGWHLQAAADHDRSDGHRPGTDHVMTQARVAADAPLAGGALAAELAWAARDFGADGFYAPFNSWEETRTLTAGVRWRGRTGAVLLEPAIAYRRHDDDFVLRREDPAFYRNVHRTGTTTAGVTARWSPGGAVRLAAGAEATGATLESATLGVRDEHRAALFAEIAAGNPAGALVTAGIRVDRDEAFGTFVSPALSAGWRAARALRLRASAGAGFRGPSWTERYYRDPVNIGSADLGVERFRTVEGGIELGGAALRVDVAAFRRRADDLIDWARPAADSAAPWRTMNVARATFTGAELAAHARAGALSLVARGTVLHVEAGAAAGSVSKYALRPLTRAASLEVTAPLPGGTTAAVRAAHHRRAGSGDWQLIDLRLARPIGRAHLFLDATNVTDTRYSDIAGLPAPGRGFSVGMRLRR
jgi:vitamin B12 transporter